MRIKLVMTICSIFARLASADTDVNIPMLLQAIATVESGGNDQAYNVREQAAGRYQIRPIYLRDVNRIIGRNAYSAEVLAHVRKYAAEVKIVYKSLCDK
jgi:hypothetical protein